MADNNASDIAVLGFQIQTANAETAFKKITDGLDEINAKTKETDLALEQKVTQSLAKMKNTATVMSTLAENFAANEEGMTAVSTAFEKLANVAKGMSELKVQATSISNAIKVLNKSGVTDLAKDFEAAFGALEGNVKTVKIAADIVNKSEIEKILPSRVTVSIDPTTFNEMIGKLEEIKSWADGIKIKVNPPDLTETKAKIDEVFRPTLSFGLKPADQLVQSFNETVKPWVEKHIAIDIPLSFSLGDKSTVDKAVKEAVKQAPSNPADAFYEELTKEIESTKKGHSLLKKHSPEWLGNILSEAFQYNQESFDWLLGSAGLPNDLQTKLAERLGEIRRDMDDIWEPKKPSAQKPTEEKTAENLGVNPDTIENIIQGIKGKISPHIGEIQGMFALQPTFTTDAFYASYDPWLQKVSEDAEELAKKLVFTPTISLPDGGKKGHKWISSKDVQDALGLTPKGGRESVLAKFAESLSDDRGKLNEMLDFKITVEPVNDETMQNVKQFTDMVEKLKDAFHTLNEDSKGVAENIAAIDKSMSAQVKTLLQATGKKAAASELDKLYAESEQAAKLEKEIKDWQKLLEIETGPLDTKNSEERVRQFKELADQLIATDKAEGNYFANRQQQQKEYNDTRANFDKQLVKISQDTQAFTRAAQNSVNAVRSQANEMYRMATTSADAKAAFKELDAVVKQFSWRIDNLPRIEPTKLTDPFVKLKAELGDTNSRLVDIGRTFGLYLSGRSIISYFKQASESANNFQMEIRRIQSLALDFDFGELRNGLMDLDARFGSVIHNAQALYMAYTSGVRGSEKDLVGFTETMSKLATTVKSDVLPTIDAVTSVMNAWNLSANSANEIADLIFSTIKYGKSNAAQLTTSLGHVVAPAAALNLQLDELGASIAVLTKTMKTNRAMTYLSNILGKMASPTKAVQEAAAELGIELSANSIKARGFAQTLKDIRLATGGDIAKIAKIFPDLRGQRAALTLLGTQYKDFEDQLVNMRNKAGSMEEALSKITDTPEAQLRALKNTWSMFGIEVGKTVNEMVTLGGVLGPVLEQVNSLGHEGRSVMGNLIASLGSLGGIAVAAKAMQAANFARLQMSYQMASAEADTHRLEMDNALLKERQALESAKILAANLKSEVVQKQLNDETLRKLKAEDEIYRTTIKRNNVALAGEQARAKFVDDRMKRDFALRTASMGESQNRITALGGWLTELTTGKGQQKIRDARNLVDRMRLDIEKDQAMLQGEAADLQKKYADAIQNLVEHSAEIRKLMHQAIRDGNLGDRENLNSFYGKIVSTIKSNTVIASQMEQFDQGERILQREMRRVILAEESKKLVEGENYEHSLLVQFVKDEIQIEQSKLNTQQANLRTMIQQNGVNEETAKLMDDIAQRKLDIIALEAKHNTIQEMIQTRTDALVGREADQVRMLEAANKAAKQLLDANNTDLETLKKKAEIEMKNAAVLGGATLAAVRNAFNAQMDYRSVAMQINALEAERATLIDDEGRMINESEDAVKRVAEIDKQRVALQQKRVDLEREFVALGVKAGNQDARNLKILQLDKAGVGLAGAVDALTRDKGVVSEAIKAMSKDVGKNIFGGAFSGTAMRSASVGMSFIPGLSKYAMPLAMMSSMDIVGKTTGGFARLSGKMLDVLGTTERLQKKGLYPLEKGVEDLTKSVLTSKRSISGLVKSLGSLPKLGLLGGSKALLAGLTGPTGLVVALGSAIITGLFFGIKSALDKTETGGPLRDIADKLVGAEDIKKYGEFLDTRIEMMRSEKDSNDSMIREMKRMISASENIQDDLIAITEKNRILNALNGLTVGGIYKSKQFRKENIRYQIYENEQEIARQEDKVLASRTVQEWEQLKIDEERLASLKELRSSLLERLKVYEQAKDDDMALNAYAEARYQLLREMMEADRDTAFAPKKDAQGRLKLAQKMTEMSLKRISELLGKDGELADLTDKTTGDIQELMRSIATDYAKKAKKAALAYEQAVEDNKSEEEIQKLKDASDKAEQDFQKKSQDLRSALSDFYSKLIGEADATVKSVQDIAKKIQKETKYNDMFTSFSLGFVKRDETILRMVDAQKNLREDFVNKAGIFKKFKDAKEAEDVFKASNKEIDDTIKSLRTARIGDLTKWADQIASFVESVSSDLQGLEKQLFEARLNSPMFKGMQQRLIGNRYGLMNTLLYGKDGKSGVYAMRSQAVEDVRRLMTLGDLEGAMAAFKDVQKYGKMAVGYEQQKADLVKLQAQKEREINQSLYQLANTLRGQFAATSQTAVDVNSIEGIRLRSRRLGENIAPPVAYNAQRNEYQAVEQAIKSGIENANLGKTLSDTLLQEVRTQLGREDVNGGKADMTKAATQIENAATIFSTTMKNMQNVVIAVKRI